MKRIDLFLNEREVEKVCKAMLKAGAPGYSVMRHVTGMGISGEISEGMDFSGLGANAHVIVFCDPEMAEAVRSAVKPVLKLYGALESAIWLSIEAEQSLNAPGPLGDTALKEDLWERPVGIGGVSCRGGAGAVRDTGPATVL
jgi:nitrogen regulatory protein PII